MNNACQILINFVKTEDIEDELLDENVSKHPIYSSYQSNNRKDGFLSFHGAKVLECYYEEKKCTCRKLIEIYLLKDIKSIASRKKPGKPNVFFDNTDIDFNIIEISKGILEIQV